MQVRQVAREPLECFVNGQLCLSTSEPISHSKVWHHAKLPPNPFLCRVFFLKSRPWATAHVSGSISCTVLYIIVSFDFLLGWWPLFPADRIRPPCARQCLLWLLYNGLAEKQRGPSVARICSDDLKKERGSRGHTLGQGGDMPLG